MSIGAGPEKPSRDGARERAIFDVLARASHDRARGDDAPDESVIAAHPDLMPELGSRLALLRTIHRTYLQARAAGAEPPQPPGKPDEANGAAESTADDAPPRAVGAPLAIPGYTIMDEISSGGQGSVFRAVQKGTDRVVAVKILPGGPLSGWRQRARFDREAQVLAKLNHPHIVGIVDHGRAADGSRFIVMDHIDGCSLDEYVRRCRDDRERGLRDIVDLFVDVARAIGEAHRCGIVHRDLKPSNIRVDRNGRPHILDFGLAQLHPGQGPRGRSVTETGQIVGSLPWASPEQVSGDTNELDQRSDVYSLGVMLYHALANQYPYKVFGPLNQVIENILRERPEPPSRAEESEQRIAHPALDPIVLKALAKSPEGRYGTAEAMASDLDQFLAGEQSQARRAAAWKKVRRWAIAMAGVLILGLTLWGVRKVSQEQDNPVESLPTLVNSVGMRFVQVPKGAFMMGSPPQETGRSLDEPLRAVRVTEAYRIGIVEVTQGQYRAAMGTLPQQIWRGDDLPVHNVRWVDAVAFCEALSRMAGEHGRQYRLPFEHEWEYACRATSSGRYGGTGKLDRMGWYMGNSGGVVHPVAMKMPNRWGLYDTHGNVREWCEEVYNPKPTASQPAAAPWHGSSGHVVRGGSYVMSAEQCRSSSRGAMRDSLSLADVGFRVVLVSRESN